MFLFFVYVSFRWMMWYLCIIILLSICCMIWFSTHIHTKRTQAHNCNGIESIQNLLRWNIMTWTGQVSIPVCTMSPSCNWNIDFCFPFSRETLADDGKHPPPLGGAVVVVVVVVVVAVVGSDVDAEQQQCWVTSG